MTPGELHPRDCLCGFAYVGLADATETQLWFWTTFLAATRHRRINQASA